jgi:hypothetical protein
VLQKFARIHVTDQAIARLQDAVGKVLDVVTAVQMLDGTLITSKAIATTTTKITHKLNRAYVGWWVVSPQGPGVVYEDANANVDKSTTIALRASADVTVSLWVF